MGFGRLKLRLWMGEVILAILFLHCLGCLAWPVSLPGKEYGGYREDDLSGAHPKWVRRNGGLLASRSRRSSSDLEVSPSQVNVTAEADLLLEFKKGITLDPLNVLSSWNSDNVSNYCSWSGVNCTTSTGPVRGLLLRGDQLGGTISPSLGSLQSLSSLDLSNNSLGGPIPVEIANCSDLIFLNLSYNVVSGRIPGELYSLTNLKKLDLSANQLTDDLLPSLSNLSALRVLRLGTNQFTGGLESVDWGVFGELENLNLSVNNFEGAVPELLSNCSSLLTLDLSQNNLVGTIPDFFDTLPKLHYMDLTLNTLTGPLPNSLSSLKSLSFLALAMNNLTGSIPAFLKNCSSLTTLILSTNKLVGEIPPEIGLLSRLELVYLNANNLTGSIPAALFNCSSLIHVILNNNELVGEIPLEIGLLSRLAWVHWHINSLTGPVPSSLANCTALTSIVMGYNYLSGDIPQGLGTLSELQFLYLSYNSFTGLIPDSLGNASNLLELILEINSLTGSIPPQLGLLKKLTRLDLSDNSLSGQLSPSLGNATSLITLDLSANQLSGQIPTSIGELVNLQGLDLANNLLTGVIPADLSNCAHISNLDLSKNFLSDRVPDELSDLAALQWLYLNNNNLTGSITSALRHTSMALVDISLAYNRFSGDLSQYDFGSLRSLQVSLDLSHNLVSGPLPSGVAALVSVQNINLSFNTFSGEIPTAFSQCVGLESLDLSSNKLSGVIPESLTTLHSLTFFNVSFNELSGSIPEEGMFANFSNGSFLGNPHLCGPVVSRACSYKSCSGIHCHRLEIIIPSVAAGIVVFFVLVAVWFLSRPKMRVQPNRKITAGFRARFLNGIDLRIVLNDANLTKFSEAIVLQTISDPSEANVVGRGARSVVYKGALPSGEAFALKRLLSSKADEDHDSTDPLSKIAGEDSLFLEAEMLVKFRHKNILKVLSLYCTRNHRALILEYMSGGSLHKHLHDTEPCLLTWQTRLKIAVGVAHGIKYLHHDFPEALIHRDLKPSNILLDDDFEPKVADFGISKFINTRRGDGEASASTFCGTVGYMPPEYASQPWVSTKGDVFSYGMILLELLTRRQPGSRIGQGSEGQELRSWVLDNFDETVFDVLDNSLVIDCRDDGIAMEQMTLLLRVGIFCTSTEPQSRPSMSDVVGMLIDIVNLKAERVSRTTVEELARADSILTRYPSAEAHSSALNIQ